MGGRAVDQSWISSRAIAPRGLRRATTTAAPNGAARNYRWWRNGCACRACPSRDGQCQASPVGLVQCSPHAWRDSEKDRPWKKRVELNALYATGAKGIRVLTSTVSPKINSRADQGLRGEDPAEPVPFGWWTAATAHRNILFHRSKGRGALPEHVGGHNEDQDREDRREAPMRAGEPLCYPRAGEAAKNAAADERRRKQPVYQA